WARKAPEFLKTLGLETEYHEYPVGHGVAPQNFYDMLAWLKK
ncbi:MAG TPA: phospholipase, partial [Flavobacterium sp.]|nr:phospholipase [Flavobacterium sp.]